MTVGSTVPESDFRSALKGDNWRWSDTTAGERPESRTRDLQSDRAAGRRPHRGDSRQGVRRESAVDAALADDRAVGARRRPTQHTYGGGSDARLLAGIMGHNLCLDIFGPPSDDEFTGGSQRTWRGVRRAVRAARRRRCADRERAFPIAGLVFERRIALRDSAVVIRETLTNIADHRSRDRLDPARDAGAAISRAGIDAVQSIRHAIESIRVDVRRAMIT